MDYDDMLGRAVDESADAPNDGGDRFDVPDPTLRTEGNETVVENFPDVADRLGRDPEHLLRHLQTEFGTAARIDDRGRARLTGGFKRERVASAVDSYAEGYVRCPDCGLPDTHLTDDEGETLLVCEACGARSEAPVGGT